MGRISRCGSGFSEAQGEVEELRKKRRSQPISRVLSWTVIPLGCASPRTSSNLPGNGAGRTIVSLFGLAPNGVYPAAHVAICAVRSYRTFSPLPACTECRRRRYIFCGTFHRLAPPRRYLASCPAEPGLSSPHPIFRCRATVWPTPVPILARRTAVILSRRALKTAQNSTRSDRG